VAAPCYEGGYNNTEECGWGGGDCIEKYPDCNVDDPISIMETACVREERVQHRRVRL
jgi:hypothetical protein